MSAAFPSIGIDSVDVIALSVVGRSAPYARCFNIDIKITVNFYAASPPPASNFFS